jgi:transcriptional regulator with XRE-family HTH domain
VLKHNRKRVEANSRISYPKIGGLLKERRIYHGWTLVDVHKMTGISISALSKIENEAMSPTYATILQLCQGLNIEIGDLLNPLSGGGYQNIVGRRSISRQHQGNTLENDNYNYTYLCSDVAHKRIVPMIVIVSARTLEDVGDLWSHVGEEYIYVLTGTLRLVTELYEPSDLKAGDSVYIDSTMPHAYLSAGDGDAKILVMCSSATPNLAQTLREILRERLAVKPTPKRVTEIPPRAARRKHDSTKA